jgi:hypothetical protein
MPLYVPVAQPAIDAPNTVAPAAAGSVAAPRVLTGAAAGSISAPRSVESVGDFTGVSLVLSYSEFGYFTSTTGGGVLYTPRGQDADAYTRIGYKSILVSASPSAAQVALIPNTFERWRPAGGSQAATFSSSTAQYCDYIAIGAHNLGTKGATVLIEVSSSTVAAFATIGTITPSDDKPIYIAFESRVVQRVRVTLTNGTGRELGVIYAGSQLVMTRTIFGGHSPITLSAKTEYRNSVSETGQWLGRSIARQGTETEYSFTLVDDLWYRENFQPFVESAKTNPFFIAWRPDLYPDEVAYVWTTDDIKPQNRGGSTRLMNFAFSVEGHDDL